MIGKMYWFKIGDRLIIYRINRIVDNKAYCNYVYDSAGTATKDDTRLPIEIFKESEEFKCSKIGRASCRERVSLNV